MNGEAERCTERGGGYEEQKRVKREERRVRICETEVGGELKTHLVIKTLFLILITYCQYIHAHIQPTFFLLYKIYKRKIRNILLKISENTILAKNKFTVSLHFSLNLAMVKTNLEKN